jgi:FixJ family two-component response regulator
MTARHRVLVVEDDRSTAEDLVDLLRSLDYEPVAVDNKRDALAKLSQEAFCVALFDLEIKIGPDSIKGHSEAGRSLVREVRRLYPEHAGACYRFPILVVSGHAREVGSAVEVMKDGADDVLQKPPESRAVSAAVRQALERSGRASHAACAALADQAAVLADRAGPSGAIVLSIPGDRDRRRTRVLIGASPLSLPDASLRVLLHLVVGKITGEKVHKTDLGARSDQGFRGISVVRDALKPALPEGVDIIKNDHQGYYWFTDEVTIGDVDPDKLVAIGDAQITTLAEQLRQHQPRKPRARRARASDD